MVDRLVNLEAFLAVVDEGSFSAAALKLDRSTAAISRQVRSLEERLGTRLLERSTRSVRVTHDGQAFFEKAGTLLAELDAAEAAFAGLPEAAHGRIRVNAPTAFGERYLAPILPDFLGAFPDVRLSLTLSDRFIDVIDEAYDIVIRISDVVEATLAARRLTRCRRVLCASPDYLERRSAPQTPVDLDDHECIGYSISTTWRFRGGVRRTGSIHGLALETNNGEVLRAAVLAGRGIALLPTFLIADDLRSGAVVPVLEEHLDADTTIHALYPERRSLPARVRVFIDFLAARLHDPPTWDQGLPLATG